jgi:hypothetical protein
MDSKDNLLRSKLLDFYKDSTNLDIFLNIVLQKSNISLRSLDWFVTNYSKKFNVYYPLNKILYYPYKSYKSQLKAYSKKYCDPFCRRERVIFDYSAGKLKDLSTNENTSGEIITTIGQLNFFKFAISNGIIDYIKDNIEKIEEDMNSTLKIRDSEKKFLKIESIKRKELSKSANRSVNITIVNAVIKFI